MSTLSKSIFRAGPDVSGRDAVKASLDNSAMKITRAQPPQNLKQFIDGYLKDGKVTVRELNDLATRTNVQTSHEDRIAYADLLINQRGKMSLSGQVLAQTLLGRLGDALVAYDLYAYEADGNLTQAEADDALIRASANGLTANELGYWRDVLKEWNAAHPPSGVKPVDTFEK